GKEDIVYLNLHEKAHGPHGLVAGTTGSGKSEVIQSYILSLAVNFHPHDVAFLLIDYKGGGMANLFKDLPHLLGTITNLDGAQSMRALVSINAELKRRQRLFATHDVNHINQYQKKYKLGEVSEPMPHLFLISDEFAELKTNQPDFMKELVSTARIGRSLGIHLILATQKPSGVVDDQIWSNSRFKLALKVADRSDSMEMLKTPDAAEITQVGRGYLQVGNNEVYELFQSAWSGADYQPDKEEQGIEDHTIYAINDIGQYEILNEDLSGLDQAESIKEVPSELHAIVGKIKELTENLSIQALPQPWLPPLPSRLFVEDMRGADELAWSGVNEELEVLLGLLDKPSQQAQAPLSINLSQDGHLILYGAPATGKTTFLQTVVLDLARHYSPSELHFYLLDFGTSGLVPMGDLPHVADVFLLDQGEKIGKFIRLLEKEINRRKKQLTEHRVGTLSMYRQLTGQVKPRIVIALDSFESMKDESFEAELLKLLTRISREGQAIGLHLVVTASRQANLRATFYSNFKHQLTLKQHDKTEVRSVVGSTGLAEIEDIKGRALYKGEEVYSLQLALPLRVEHDLELVDRMREEVSRQKAAWSGQVPEAIPMVPEELTREDFLSRSSVQNAIASGQIPLGLDLETVEAVSWDLAVGNFVYLYEKESQLNQQIHLMMQELDQAGYKIALVQPVHGTLSHSSARDYNSEELYGEMLEALERQLENRMKERQTALTHVIIWTQYDDIVPSLSAGQQESLAKLFEKGARYGFVNLVASKPGALTKLQDKATRVVKTWKEGLLAIRVTDQSIISPSNRPLREGQLGPQENYVVVDNLVSKIIVPVE
ncbi:type VII secretion protein EssC, partial [Streptococcus suis]